MKAVYNILLHTISPLHIGTGRSLTSVGEFIATGSSVNIIDQRALNELLVSKEGLMQRYLNHIIEEQENANVFRFFREEAIEGEIKYSRELPLHAQGFNPESNNMLELMIETDGRKYIPGSSVKGAIRTMFFALEIIEDSSLRNKINEIVLAPKSDLYQIKNKVEDIEKDLFQNDMMNFIVRDSQPFSEQDICVEIAKREHLFGVDSEGLDVLRECVAKDSATSFEVVVEKQFNNPSLRFFNDEKAFGNMFAIINQVTEKHIEFELELLKLSSHRTAQSIKNELISIQKQIKTGKNKEAYLRLGKGKTFYFMVILPFLDEQAREKVLHLMKVEPSSVGTYPKTRILNDSNEMYGWVRLGIEEKPVENKPLFENNVDELIVNETVLIARCMSDKLVHIQIKGDCFENVQLVNKLKINLDVGADVKVMVGQITKEGRLNQVKLIIE